MKAFNPITETGFVSLEGYMAGRLVVLALESMGDEITRKGLLDVIEKTGTFDLGGVTLNYGPGDNQGMDEIFLTVIQADGRFKAVDELEG